MMPTRSDIGLVRVVDSALPADLLRRARRAIGRLGTGRLLVVPGLVRKWLAENYNVAYSAC